MTKETYESLLSKLQPKNIIDFSGLCDPIDPNTKQFLALRKYCWKYKYFDPPTKQKIHIYIYIPLKKPTAEKASPLE